MPHLYPLLGYKIHTSPKPPFSYSFVISIFAKLEYGNEKICQNITSLINLKIVAESQESAHPVILETSVGREKDVRDIGVHRKF